MKSPIFSIKDRRIYRRSLGVVSISRPISAAITAHYRRDNTIDDKMSSFRPTLRETRFYEPLSALVGAPARSGGANLLAAREVTGDTIGERGSSRWRKRGRNTLFSSMRHGERVNGNRASSRAVSSGHTAEEAHCALECA